jgi:hypothetical protein
VTLGVELSDQADGVTWSVRAQRRIEAKQSESSA